MLTEEEKDQLRLDCANAKSRVKEAWQVLQAIEKIAKTYWRIHDLWRERFEKADRQLAMEERLTVIRDDKKEKKQKLTRADLEDILRELEEEDG